mmetsp:Transcript_3723/g.4886  ORF Transcript_3723/g.4886 Transcript_3723/m.4886 type:complete len:291 (-) Transcript_3723:1940-2812(-)
MMFLNTKLSFISVAFFAGKCNYATALIPTSTSPLLHPSRLLKPLYSDSFATRNQPCEEQSKRFASNVYSINRMSSTATSLHMSEQTKDQTDPSKEMSNAQLFNAVRSNLTDGELGSRGEIYFVLQAVLVLCILFGDVPVIGDTLKIILGPGLVLLGGSVAALGVVELGANLSPFPKPPKNSALVTDGLVFSEIRHPIYAGLIYLMVGISMWSGSAMRILLCVGLWYLLDIKSDFEEEELIKKFGSDYIEYRNKVKGKLVPTKFTDVIENAANSFVKKEEKEIVESDGDFQ